ncbi:uncharacterized protein LOC134927841 isoform X2 [Pseudophryne corroboree]|uniref:uncharacterized protein LOC134927841 isoform X2 n=1 Tax=Pseudophryne corroboree TaxID=495146 RepID=UPI003081B7DF
MNHTGNHSGPKNKKKKNENTGLQYLVALKLMDSTECLIKCNLCKFKGNDSDMRNHLVGLDHLTSFLEKHYMFLLEDVKHTGFQKPQLELLLREYAREIERLEGTGAINIEVVFESEFRKEQDTWVELTDSAKYRSALHKEFPFYRRKMALSYSRNLKSSSQTEASGLLSLTQQLLNNLEQYYLKCKPPSTPGSSGIISTIATIETPSNMLPSSGNKNNDYTTNLESTIMKSSRDIEEPSTSSMYQSNAEYTHRQFTGHESQIPDTSGYGQVHVEQNAERRGHVFHSSVNDHFSNIEATSESQPSAAPIVSYAKEFINTDETNAIVPDQPDRSSITDQYTAEYTHRQFTGHKSQIPDTSGYGQVHVEQNVERRGHVFHSSVNDHFSNIEATSESQPSAAPIVSYTKEFINTDETNAIIPDQPNRSSITDQYTAEYTHRQFTGHKSQIPDISGYGQVHVEQNVERRGHVFHSSVNDHFSNIEATSERQPSAAPIVSYTKEFINTDETNTIVPDQSSSHTSSSCEQSSEMSSSRHSVGKTSKALSPDILLLLKGKDASTVTSILRTLSPFYPALQDVNLEILGQVLVNTGVLD